MGLKRIKISELTLSDNLKGLYTIGVKLINGVQTSVKVSLEHIQTAYENAVAATKKAETAANSANTAAGNADTQADRAKEQADNPPKMGDNGNWWKWDEAQKKYVDTGVLAKGGVLYPTFSIDDDDMILYMEFEDEVSDKLIKFDEQTGELYLNVG
jgi:hypothetical protein|nr:MAG: hypothetical protein [Bacteriophage sp.]